MAAPLFHFRRKVQLGSRRVDFDYRRGWMPQPNGHSWMLQLSGHSRREDLVTATAGCHSRGPQLGATTDRNASDVVTLTAPIETLAQRSLHETR